MSRLHAAFYNLLISGVVLTGLTGVTLMFWYPDFFYTIDGGWEGLRIIIAVELVLGPLLTLVIFKPGKPGLKFDLAVIGVVRVACLTAGTLIVYNERPLFFIFYEDHFYSASADTFARYDLELPDPASFSNTTPARVFVNVPQDPIEEADLRGQLYSDGVPFWLYEPRLEPLDDHMDRVMSGGFALDTLIERDKNGALDMFLAEYGGTADDYAFYPIHSRYENPFLAIRRSDRLFVDILKIPALLASDGEATDPATTVDKVAIEE